MALDLVALESTVWIVRTVLDLSFLIYGLAKLLDLPSFVEGAVSWDVLGPAIVRPLARLLPFAEVFVGASLLLGFTVQLAATGAALILGTFAIAIILNLIKGRRVPCFCAGASSNEQIGIATLLRIGVLGFFAYLTFTGPDFTPILPAAGQAASFQASIVVLLLGVLLALLPPLEVATREAVALRKDRRLVREVAAIELASSSSPRGA